MREAIKMLTDLVYICAFSAMSMAGLMVAACEIWLLLQ